MPILLIILSFFLSTQAHAEGATLGLGFSTLDGGVYVGGQKTPASFYEASLTYRGPGSIYGGAEVNYLYNESSTKNTGLLALVGKNFEISEKVRITTEALVGFGFLREKTNIQDIDGSGMAVGLRANMFYKFDEHWAVGGSASWKHYMYSNSFWGEDIYKDMVIDQKGLSLSLEYLF